MNRMDPISTSMEELASQLDPLMLAGELESPTGTTLRSAASDEEAYNTVSSAPPKRRAGRTKFRETRHPVYKGVRRRNGGKWVCEVREPNKKSRIWLGTFPTAEMAARAHDVAAMALRGRGACLNFADSARLLPALPASATPREIQRAAAEAVEAFRPLAAAAEGSGDQPEDAAAAPPPPPPGDVEAGGADGGFPEAALQGYLASASMLSPPHHGIQTPQWGGNYWDDVEDECHVSLWSYSI